MNDKRRKKRSALNRQIRTLNRCSRLVRKRKDRQAIAQMNRVVCRLHKLQ